MRTNPLHDSLQFLLGRTEDHHRLGLLGTGLAAVFGLALLLSLMIAVANWRADPQQRRASHLWFWLVRVMMGAMWFQGSLWKLPLPVSGGLRYWTEQLRENAAFPWYHTQVVEFLLPNLHWIGPIIWLTELGMALALVLGFAVRTAGLVGMVFTANLWIGLYHNGAEWPWTYAFILLIEGSLVAGRAGHALGLDALLTRRLPHGAARHLHRLVA